VRTYYHPYLFQIRVLDHMVGNDHVPDMYRIEGSEKQARFHANI